MKHARLSILLLLIAAIGCGPRHAELQIEMRSPADRAHLVRGWSGFEGQDAPKPFRFCWIEGTSAKVNVGRVPRTGTAHLRIVGWPFSNKGLPVQRMQLWVNSLFIDRQAMRGEPVEYSWTFPARLFQQGSNDLYLVFDRANRPSDTVPGSGDSRELAAAIQLLELTVEP